MTPTQTATLNCCGARLGCNELTLRRDGQRCDCGKGKRLVVHLSLNEV
jgi:hypothetical protein